MKILRFSLLFVLLLFFLLFLKSYIQIHQELNTHIPEIGSNSSLSSSSLETFSLNENQKIGYFYFPAPHPQGVIILLHGYANPGGKNQLLDQVSYLQEAGYSLYLPDLPSFGDSDGQKVTLGTTEWPALASFYDFVKSRHEDLKVGYLGISMGAVVAINTAAESGRADFVIASVPFSSPSTLYQYRYHQSSLLFLPTRLALLCELGVNYENSTPQKTISKLNTPILLFSAQNDSHVNPKDAALLYTLAPTADKELWSADSDHDIYAALPDEFEEHVLSFLAKIQ